VNYYVDVGIDLIHDEGPRLFLPPDPTNLLTVWRTIEAQGLQLWAGAEPLGKPLDRVLADRSTSASAQAKSLYMTVAISSSNASLILG
jgi:hypothetical protein